MHQMLARGAWCKGLTADDHMVSVSSDAFNRIAQATPLANTAEWWVEHYGQARQKVVRHYLGEPTTLPNGNPVGSEGTIIIRKLSSSQAQQWRDYLLLAQAMLGAVTNYFRNEFGVDVKIGGK